MMTYTTAVTPEQEERLKEKAALLGKDTPHYVQDIVSQEAEPDPGLTLLYSMGVSAAAMSDEATRRESLYDDHE